MTSTFTPEPRLLRPVDPSTPSDDWPILTLSSVEVFPSDVASFDPASFTSLLTADVHTPLLLRAKLPSVPRDLAHLRIRPGGAELIELAQVRQFAYGQYDDGRIDIWAAGKAGWFTVRPSRAYKAIYDAMIEAIEALYYAADVYSRVNETKSRKGKRRRADVSAEEVFAGYAQANQLAGEEIGRMVFVKHRGFLIKSMVQGKEEVEWEKTGIWEWLVDTFPDDVDDLKNQLQGGKVRSKAGTKRKRDDHDKQSERVGSIRSGRSRGRMGRDEPSTPRTETPHDSDESERPGKRPRGEKGKSVLRPKSTTFIPIEAEDDNVDELADLPQSDLRPERKLPPVKIRLGARNASHLVSKQDGDVTAGAEVVDEGIDMGHDDSEKSEDSTELMIPNLTGFGSSIPVRLRKEHTAGNGEGDTWSCPLDGCMHKVYAASDAASQKLIKGHYRVHVNNEDAEVRMQLVKRMEAPGQPVNRLMKRIQEIGGRGFPAPIVRRY
ncbi:hypothetical protein KVT40_000850 [Elsinoe batatas]|uniref:Uncharacterized protein n=1 Tax=Elsinoe batatas TaxID=2601811 RepID=A0A8K0PGT2_9PEZI|nr:hypothetical protein KVT40_000850 [Elsinoe batatas]